MHDVNVALIAVTPFDTTAFAKDNLTNMPQIIFTVVSFLPKNATT